MITSYQHLMKWLTDFGSASSVKPHLLKAKEVLVPLSTKVPIGLYSSSGVTFLAESSGEKQSPGNRCDNRTRGDDSPKTQNVPVILKTPVLEDTDDGRLKDIAIL